LDARKNHQEYHDYKAQGRLVPDGTNVRQGLSEFMVS